MAAGVELGGTAGRQPASKDHTTMLELMCKQCAVWPQMYTVLSCCLLVNCVSHALRFLPRLCVCCFFA
jgi:hypothetical protein